jgi:hypothetical protein
MKLNLTSTKWKLLIASLLGASTLAYCAPADWFGLRKPDFELTGQVLDFDTKQPIEGAYVLAVYQTISSAWLVGSSLNCVKTKGMMSDKEGRFHFPVEKLDQMSPGELHAIKPDYFLKTRAEVSDADFKAQNKSAYSNRHVYLKKQDAAKPDFQYGFIGCYRPESNEAIEAAVRFTQIEMSEQIKYGRDGKNPAEGIELMQRAASRAEPTNQPNKK